MISLHNLTKYDIKIIEPNSGCELEFEIVRKEIEDDLNQDTNLEFYVTIELNIKETKFGIYINIYEVNCYLFDQYIDSVSIPRVLDTNHFKSQNITIRQELPIIIIEGNESYLQYIKNSIYNSEKMMDEIEAKIFHDYLIDCGCTDYLVLDHFKNWIEHKGQCKVIKQMLT